ncbi:MAG: uroporphyrinogen-III synthase [Actinomycetota bacterium]
MSRPLTGVRVVVTRAAHQASSLAGALEELGAEVIYLPVISIAPPSAPAELDAGLRRLDGGTYAWVLFTSANGVARVFERLDALALGVGARIGAVGGATKGALERRGVTPELVPDAFTAAALAAALGRGSGRVLLPRVEGAPSALPDSLRASGWSPEELAAYRNVPAPWSPELETVRGMRFDAVTFLSGSAARGFVTLVAPPEALELAPGQAARRVVACIGPETAATARAAGLRVDVVATEHSARGLALALAAALHPASSPSDGNMGA